MKEMGLLKRLEYEPEIKNQRTIKVRFDNGNILRK
jgi:hypothetical protein